MESPSNSVPIDLEALSDEELDKLLRELQEDTRGAEEEIAAFEEEQKELDARLEELKSKAQEIAAKLESKGYKIVNDEVVPIIDLEPLRKWAVAADAKAAEGWAKISEKVDRCETAFNLRINGVMQILQSQPGLAEPYHELLQKYLTGGTEEDTCDPAKFEDEKAVKGVKTEEG
ncbi:hypothetical protein KCU65_g8888, partial [Aureobasidium melanogenum]